MLKFVVDEDVIGSVSGFLSESHDVELVSQVLGEGTPDSDVIAYARAQGAVLVTSDRRLAKPLRQSGRAPCLYLSDLGVRELERVVQLLPTIESEAAALGERFWMQISADLYVVNR